MIPCAESSGYPSLGKQGPINHISAKRACRVCLLCQGRENKTEMSNELGWSVLSCTEASLGKVQSRGPLKARLEQRDLWSLSCVSGSQERTGDPGGAWLLPFPQGKGLCLRPQHSWFPPQRLSTLRPALALEVIVHRNRTAKLALFTPITIQNVRQSFEIHVLVKTIK